MDTSKFKTKTSLEARNNGTPGSSWLVALDIGYSAVKVFSPNMIARFPSYARPVSPNQAIMGTLPESYIFYEDLQTHETWCVGESAYALIDRNDTSDSDAALYGRERYGNPMFRVIARTGLGLAMMKNNFGDPAGKPIFLQTGLPQKYKKMDTPLFMDALVGKHDFKIQIGSGKEMEYHIELTERDIHVMSQPMGTLFSVATDRNHAFVPDAGKYFSKNVLVFDPGFGTLDLFPIKAHMVGAGETFDNLGMKRVLQETINGINERYAPQEITIPAMQKYLETGKVRIIDRRSFEAKDVSFDDILSAANKKVCAEAIERMTQVVSLFDYDYLIITGGTGAAWSTMIRERLKNLSTLTIIDGNQNDPLPHVFSNVRGYYNYRYQKFCAGN